MKYTHEDGTPFTKEEFLQKLKTDKEFNNEFGNKGIDQIANLINDLKTNPDSRRLMVNAWNVGELNSMTLPPCHYGFQVYTRELTFMERLGLLSHLLNKSEVKLSIDNQTSYEDLWNYYKVPARAISLQWSQRSVDSFLGLPFNIASYGLLLEIIAKEVNMVPDELIGNLGDTHLYLNHIEQAKEQIGRELSIEERREIANSKQSDIHYGEFISPIGVEHWDRINIPTKTREPFTLPKLMICGDMTRTDGFTVPFDELEYHLIKLIDYQSHPTIKAPLSN